MNLKYSGSKFTFNIDITRAVIIVLICISLIFVGQMVNTVISMNRYDISDHSGFVFKLDRTNGKAYICRHNLRDVQDNQTISQTWLGSEWVEITDSKTTGGDLYRNKR